MINMTDLELADKFFERLKTKGFGVKRNTEAYGDLSHLDSPPVVWEIYGNNSDSSPCWSFDFHSDGSFYRASGFIDGYWSDEIDLNKY